MMSQNQSIPSKKSPPPRRLKTPEQERAIIEEIVNELNKREKELNKKQAKIQSVIWTEKEKARNERMKSLRESAKKYLSKNKQKSIIIKTKVSRE